MGIHAYKHLHPIMTSVFKRRGHIAGRNGSHYIHQRRKLLEISVCIGISALPAIIILGALRADLAGRYAAKRRLARGRVRLRAFKYTPHIGEHSADLA